MPELDLGNVMGPDGKSAYQGAIDAGYSGSETDFNEALAKVPYAVRYDAAQSLTDTQKTQARSNIEAAPNGYGLGGGAKQLTSADDLNTTLLGGWYYYWKPDIPQNAPNGIDYCRMRVDPGYNNGVGWTKQTLMDANNGVEQTRWLKDNNGWQPWEYLNPPMQLDVEYRTTERYLGKPVYVKVVDCGALPNNTQKSISSGVNNIDKIVAITGRSYSNTTADVNIPLEKYTGNKITLWCNSAGSIFMYANFDASGGTATATMKYTKATD